MSRIDVVLRVRELTERRRLTELVATERAASAAHAAADAARGRRDGLAGGSGATSAAALRAHRHAGVAAQDAVVTADARIHVADRDVELAARRRVDAAVARRSVERVDERRREHAAHLAARRTERQLDDLALDRWRRR